MKNKIKERLLSKNFEEDTAVELSERAIAVFLERTNRTKVPESAEILIIDIALCLSNFYGSKVNDKEIKSIKEGDVSITYKELGTLEEELSNFDKRLNKYKVMRMI